MKKTALRVVGGPYDGAVYDADDAAEIVQIGVREPGQDSPVATYRRKLMAFDDGSEPLAFLCWSEFTDRQAMAWLLKIVLPVEEAADAKPN